KECKKLNSNATLLIIRSESEQDFLNKWLFHDRGDDKVKHGVWIGAFRLNDTNKFKWEDGSEFTFTYWNQDEPNNALGRFPENCVEMNAAYDFEENRNYP